MAPPRQVAQYQRRLRAVRFDRRYWDARNDSLRRALATQRADTQRLQTLAHLFNLTDLSQEALPDLLLEHREALRLATRLGYPEQVLLRKVVAFDELALAPAPPLRAMRDILRAALPTGVAGRHQQPAGANRSQPDVLRPAPGLRAAVRRWDECGHLLLGRYYGAWAIISQRLRAAKLFRLWSAFRYGNELVVIEMSYDKWGNYARALPYLQWALTIPGPPRPYPARRRLLFFG